jgi:hypothetical protein
MVVTIDDCENTRWRKLSAGHARPPLEAYLERLAALCSRSSDNLDYIAVERTVKRVILQVTENE